jgi:hypothetical protein
MSITNVPAVTIAAIGSGRKVTLNKIGVPAVLIFHGRGTAEAARQVNGPVRDRYPESNSLLVASITDLHTVPGLLRGVVRAFIQDAYEEACRELPAGWSPEEYLLLLPDWDGKITRAFGMKDIEKNAGVAVLDKMGAVIGTYQGKDLANQTLQLLLNISQVD